MDAVDRRARGEQIEQVFARAQRRHLPFRLEVIVHGPALHDHAAEPRALDEASFAAQ